MHQKQTKHKQHALKLRIALASVGLSLILGNLCASEPLPIHPFRKVGTNHCDLRPLFQWIKQGQVGQNPMWKWKYFDGLVAAVSDNVLLVEPHPMPPPLRLNPAQRAGAYVPPRSYPQQFKTLCLTNHPKASTVKDGDAIAFVAMEAGTFQYTDALGAVRTVALYDYGIPITNTASAKP